MKRFRVVLAVFCIGFFVEEIALRSMVWAGHSGHVQIITQSFPHQYERYGYGHRYQHSSGISGEGAAILVATVLGLGALSVWNRSLNDTATVAVVQERERTERERIRAEATKYAIGRDGNSSYRSSEGYAELQGHSGNSTQCTDAELKAARVQYGTYGVLRYPNGGDRCHYDLR